MYAITIDGELVAAKVELLEVQKILRFTSREEKVEVASFEVGAGWVPVCLERLH